MPALHEITGNYLALLELEDVDITDTLEAIEGEFKEKVNSIVHVLTNQDGDVGAIDAEIKRLQARKRAITNRQDSLKDYLRTNMEATNTKKISCQLFTIACVKGRDIAVIDDSDSIPDDYVSVKTTITPDKNAISRALKDGIDIPGARLEQAKSAIKIS